ncbi:cysteine peptidase, Clan CA, family C19 [Strigomonas culicis]|uniref:Ubiquitin carboxyl-terminal hydrolase n=1 Tax=Strigomonas culicis TaxID=28005 RepID=S9UBW7_9TRYP|nr:cysteine peptidase, Clan CA, family C19 [Strigomonas culicis]|eukprot:EPY26229.1 cysteine peptidase, Clan CA, family C19 [Strigomonas culicis]
MMYQQSNEACPHCWDEAALRYPSHSTCVQKEECAYCCYTCRHENGVLVCMTCFAGVCVAHAEKHMAVNPTHTMYTLVKELPEEKKEEEQVRDVYHLGVVAAKTYQTAVCCGACKLRFQAVPDFAVESYTGITNAPVPGAQTDDGMGAAFVKPQCPHLICLEQAASPFAAGVVPSSESKCSVNGCECRSNNWMCLTCGAIGCPRPESGGQGHALRHYKETGHPASVKLGTVTPGGADFYCYSCDDDVSDVHFAAHMAHFGINVATSKKTAKTMGEMMYDYTSQFDFNKITESGMDLKPMYGPGRTGIYNIGNTCYIASVVQCLVALKAFQDSFYVNKSCVHQQACKLNPYDCRTCQVERLASGLLSGDFSKAAHEPMKWNGVGLRSFKKVFAQQHPEFSSGLQQDAQEYFLYLLEELRRHVRTATGTTYPYEMFDFLIEHRLQCSNCRKVRYTKEKESCLSLPIPVDPLRLPQGDVKDEDRPRCQLSDCFASLVAPSEMACRCEACGQPAVYTSTTKIVSFPDILPVYIRRPYFDPQTCTTKKMNVYVDVPETVQLEAYRGHGASAGEALMPPPATARAPLATASGQTPVDEVALVSVISMGIDMEVARYALLQTNMNVERAVDYIFSHPNLVEEMTAAEAGQPAPPTVPEDPRVMTDGPAQYQLVSMISHIGGGAKTGHYVCHVKDRETGKWLLFNDEKVGISQEPPFLMASIYFFERRK